MNNLDCETLAERVFDSVAKYLNRNLADLRKYIDAQITLANERTDQAEERVLKVRTVASDPAGTSAPPADLALRVNELEKIVHNCERRATRQADHLLNLQSSVRKLQGKD